jgi:hypothetical protein
MSKGLSCSVKKHFSRLQEVVQLVGITPHEAEITSSNLSPPSSTDMSKKKKRKRVAFLTTIYCSTIFPTSELGQKDP